MVQEKNQYPFTRVDGAFEVLVERFLEQQEDRRQTSCTTRTEWTGGHQKPIV